MIYSIFYTHTHFWHQNKRAKLFLRTSIFGGVQLENFTFRTLYKELRTLYKELKEFRSITPVPTLLVWIYLYLKINWRLSLTSSKNPAVHFFVEKNQWYTLSDLHQSINFVNHVFELLVYIFFIIIDVDIRQGMTTENLEKLGNIEYWSFEILFKKHYWNAKKMNIKTNITNF